jgi:asparagine synthase (glutamine-hydrolysing)
VKSIFNTALVRRLAGIPGRPVHSPVAERSQLISDIRASALTYLSPDRLESIARTCSEIEERNLPGAMLEAGCALGGSAILISKLKRQDRAFSVYDVFGMIPPPSDQDGEDVHNRYATIRAGKSKGIGNNTYYGYEDNLYELVRSNLGRFGIYEHADNVTLIRGLLQDTMKISAPVAFAHVDVDWYEPVKVCLERIIPRLVTGGSVIVDDYHDWSGCRRAVDGYFAAHVVDVKMDDAAGSLKITRLR